MTRDKEVDLAPLHEAIEEQGMMKIWCGSFESSLDDDFKKGRTRVREAEERYKALMKGRLDYDCCARQEIIKKAIGFRPSGSITAQTIGQEYDQDQKRAHR